VEWFTIISKELSNPAIVLENMYSMDGTDVLLSILGSLKVLATRENLRNHWSARVKQDSSHSNCMYLC
jgi:hypothetical protein